MASLVGVTNIGLYFCSSLFNERNDEFNCYQDAKFGPIEDDVDMRTCKIKEDSTSYTSLTKQQKKDLLNKHIDRKL